MILSPFRGYFFIPFCAGLLLVSCHQRSKSISFYYWRTAFHLDSLEKQALHANSVETLYTRYFDVDMLPGDTVPQPVAVIGFDTARVTAAIIPVIYIKNRVWERSTISSIQNLSQKINSLVNSINHSANISTAAIQFDCDWTETTRDKYFLFLHQYKIRSKQIISATIRLHQVKYPGRTGIPPADYGVLMYYNMGEIDTGTKSSIYEKSTAAKYEPFIKTYPLTLDIALPIFAWGLQVREGKVIKLLNKMSFIHFENDTNFIRTAKDRFLVKHACFHGGYYFKETDIIKTENTPEEALMNIITQVNKYSNHKIRNLIFYDLDKENLSLYDKNVFKKMVGRLD